METDRRLATAVLVAAVVLSGCAGILPGTPETDVSETTTSTLEGPTTTTHTVTTTAPTTTSVTTTATETTRSTRTTTGTTRTTTARTPIYETGGGCSDAWISLWGLPDADFWLPDAIQVGFDVGPNASLLVIVEANGSVVGVESVRTQGTGLRAQGYVVTLDRALTGVRAVQATMYADRNGNGRLDDGVDRPCAGQNGVVDTTNATVDFDRLNESAS